MTEATTFESDEAIIQACATAFYYKSQVRALFLKAGVPPAMYDRHGDLSKFQIARLVLGELDQLGESGRKVKRKLVTELAGLRTPMENVDNPVKGKAALDHLRELARAERVVVEADVKRTDAARKKRELKERAREDTKKKVQELRDRFRELATGAPSPQQRGLDFEPLLAELFTLHEIEYRKSYRSGAEQIDGAMHYKGFDYLVESKWEKAPTGVNDLYAFRGKVTGKAESTRGLFIAQVPFRPEVIEQLGVASRRLILMDGVDLALVFEGQFTLTDVLDAKTAKAAQEGVVYYRMATHRR
jgi:hypothetical protein